MNPYVSIVIPAYNESDNILACINSLKSQNFPNDNYEIIVVDNNSTDNTREILKSLDVAHTIEYRKGPAAAKNAGIKLAKGEIIVFIDGDCVASNEWLDNMVAGFKDSKVGCVAGEIRIRTVKNQTLSALERYLIKKGHLSQKSNVKHHFLPFAATANVAYRREVIEEIGLFDNNLIIGEDVDLSWRMQLFTEFKLKYVPKAIVFHPCQSSPRSLFRQKRQHAYGAVALYKKYRKYRLRESNNLRQTYWEYRSIISRCVKLLFYKLQKNFMKKNTVQAPVNEYQLLLEIASKVGQIHGSLTYRIWFV